MKQEEKEQQLTAEEFFRNKLKEKYPFIGKFTLHQEMITAEEGMKWAHEFKESYHQQKRFVRTENGTTLLELVFRKVDEHIKLENKNGWWDEYKGLMLRAEQEQTEMVNLDELDSIRNDLYDSVPTGTVDVWSLLKLIKKHLEKLDSFIHSGKQLQWQKQSEAVEFAEWTCINDYFFQQCDKRWFGIDQYLVANTTEELYHQFLTSKTK